MISKNLYFNMFREDMKRRIWTIALAMLAFVVGLPIYTMLRLDRIESVIESSGIVKAQAYYASFAGTGKEGLNALLIITVAGAILCAVSGYAYLYSKTKVDLYHSVPLKREKRFAIVFINGIVIYVIPYLLNLILYFIIGAANGLLTKQAIGGAIIAFFINLSGYLLIYSISIIAVLLTGNLIVGLLGIAVFMFYGPALLVLRMAIYDIFFETFYPTSGFNNTAQYLSPIYAYSSLNYGALKNQYFLWIGIIIITIVAIVIGFIINRIRPSEAAGSAMAFQKTQVVIKFLIVLPTSIFGGLLFMGMTESASFKWMIFGIIFIGFLAHGIIEIIYNSDFKCMIANKLQLLLCIILSLGIAEAANIDLFHYDSYIPKENKIASMGISFDYLESMNEYYDFSGEYDGTMQYRYNSYVNKDTYRLHHMKIKEIQNAYQLVQYAIENNVNEIDSQKDSSQNSISFIVKYNLKNKKEKYREYTVALDDIVPYIDQLYQDENYKEGVYQILTLDKNLFHSVSYFNQEDGVDESLKLSEQQMQELIGIYNEELKNLSGDELLNAIPVTQLTFEIGKEENIPNQSYYENQSYYVYSSFEKTIAYMESLGANLNTSINLDNIKSITITKYDHSKMHSYGEETYSKQPKEYTFKDKEQINSIVQALVLERFVQGRNLMNIDYDLGVDINYKYAVNSKEMGYIIKDKLPENISKQIE